MTTTATFTKRELQKCAEREVALRKNVFHKWNKGEAGEIEIAKMQAIADHFREEADADEQAGRNPDGMMFVETKRTMNGLDCNGWPIYEHKPGDYD